MPDLVARDIPEVIMEKLRFLKKEHGFGDKEWRDWVIHLTRGVFLDTNIEDRIHNTTMSILGPKWMGNFADNMPKLQKGKSFGDLPQHQGHSALIIGAGPSVMKNQQLQLLASSGYKGVIISTDRMLIPCLKTGVIPSHVVSVDGHESLIAAFFDDPIVREYGNKVKACVASTVSPNTIAKMEEAGMEIYWFHGMLDTLTQSDSLTYWMDKMVHKTIISCGGNCGTTGVVLGYCFQCNPIAFIGLNFGYLEDTRMEETAYYKDIKPASEKMPDPNASLMSAYTKIKHPFFNTVALTDCVFLKYKNAFLNAITWTKAKHIKVINCFPSSTIIEASIPSQISSAPDFVTSNDGRVHQVTKKYERNYEGLMSHIRLRALPPIDCTPEHSLLVARLHAKDLRERRRELHQGSKFSLNWVPAKDLIPHQDCLLSTFTDYNPVSSITIMQGRGQKTLPKSLRVNADTSWLIGLYAADGGICKPRSLTIACEPNNSQKVERLRSIFHDELYYEVSIEEYQNHTRVLVHSIDLVDNFRKWCGNNCYDKHVPAFALNTNMIEGVLSGDGYVNSHDGGADESIISTVSPVLARQLFATLLRIGEYPRLSYRRNKGGFKNATPSYDIGWGHGSWHYCRRWNNYYLMPVLDTITYPYKGIVYNLEVSGTQNYIADGVISHNCTEGGIIFGPGLDYMWFKDFLKQYKE